VSDSVLINEATEVPVKLCSSSKYHPAAMALEQNLALFHCDCAAFLISTTQWDD